MIDKVIDWTLAAKLIGGDNAFAKEMMDTLIECIPIFRQELSVAFEKKDWIVLKKVAHKLHGATCYTGTPRLKKAAKHLELTEKNIKNAYEQVMRELLAVEHA